MDGPRPVDPPTVPRACPRFAQRHCSPVNLINEPASVPAFQRSAHQRRMLYGQEDGLQRRGPRGSRRPRTRRDPLKTLPQHPYNAAPFEVQAARQHAKPRGVKRRGGVCARTCQTAAVMFPYTLAGCQKTPNFVQCFHGTGSWGHRGDHHPPNG